MNTYEQGVSIKDYMADTIDPMKCFDKVKKDIIRFYTAIEEYGIKFNTYNNATFSQCLIEMIEDSPHYHSFDIINVSNKTRMGLCYNSNIWYDDENGEYIVNDNQYEKVKFEFRYSIYDFAGDLNDHLQKKYTLIKPELQDGEGHPGGVHISSEIKVYYPEQVYKAWKEVNRLAEYIHGISESFEYIDPKIERAIKMGRI